MKLITYNLHKGVDRRRRPILHQVLASLHAHDPDVLACQEVFHPAGGQPGQCEAVQAALGHRYVFGPNAFYRRGCHGNATFSRFEVLHHANVDVSESILERRGILRTQLQADGFTVDVLNVHFSLTRGQRRRQWARLFATIDACGDGPLLVCGDFNDWSRALDRKAETTGMLRNALWLLPEERRHTFPARRPTLPLDRVYYRGLLVRSVRVLDGPPWDRLSDHLPVAVEMEPA